MPDLWCEIPSMSPSQSVVVLSVRYKACYNVGARFEKQCEIEIVQLWLQS